MEQTKKDEYLSALSGNSATPQNQVAQEGQVNANADTDYYEALKSESYKSMLDAEVQASVARDQTNKYMSNTINAGGYGTQGMSESAQLGTYQTYQKALSDAQATNSANQVSIGQAQIEAQKESANSEFEGLTTLMSSATDSDQLASILGNYDIQVDDKGNLIGKGLENMDANSVKQLRSLYTLYNSQFDTPVEKSIAGKQSYDGYDQLKGLILEDGTNAGVNTEHEIKYITSNEEFLSKLTNGMVVCIQNGSTPKQKAYLQFYNGKWYQVDASAYWSSNNKQLIKGK